MSNITDMKSALTQKGLDTFCHKFHIPENVHPQLSSPNQTMHERPAGKIGVYTRFFEYANFRLPLSTFLVDVLSIEPTVGLFRCFYINSKNKGWMSFSKRYDNSSVCYTKPLDSLKHWNDHFFWVDAFACPVSSPWHTDKNVSKDPLPKSTKFNVDDYAALVAQSALFLYDDGEGGCLSLYIVHPIVFDLAFDYLFVYAEMDLSAFIHVVDPTKVKIVEREHAEGEKKLLDSTIGRVVPLLPITPARSESDLEASVDKLFDEGGNTDQGDSAAGSSHHAEIEPVTVAEDIAVVTAGRPKRQCKKRSAVTDASGSSHPPKKLRGGHGTSSGVATGGKSLSVLKELLASSILNVEVGVEAVATLPLITSSISATP
ncbi:hypothetical protein Tco_0740180 [Tanacetum coccineum]